MHPLYQDRNAQKRTCGIKVAGGGDIRLHLIGLRLIVLPGLYAVGVGDGAVYTA